MTVVEDRLRIRDIREIREIRDFRGAAPRPTARYVGFGLVACGAVLVVWLLVLSVSLPTTALVPHWSAMWVGLDTMEALGLAATGFLLLRRDPRRCLTAAATAALLVVDAWFDVLTAVPGTELGTALAMALGAELPLATLCGVLAVRSLPRRETAYVTHGTREPHRPVAY